MMAEYPLLFAILIPVCILFGFITLGSMLIWAERRLLGLWQLRYGPNRVGPFGLLQVVADTVKMFFKEDWIPPFADKSVFVIAPAIIMTTVLLSFMIVPVSPDFVVFDSSVGLLVMIKQ